MPMEFHPRVVFERLFGTSPDTSSRARLALIEKRQSLLDGVTEKVSALQKRIGAPDRAKLTQYLDAVRDVERRLQNAEAQAERELPDVEKPAGVPARFDEHAKLMFDLALLAFQTDMTRVFSFALGRELSVRTFPEIGVPDGHHPLSHHENDPDKIAKLAKLQTYQMQSFADFLARLAATREGGGTLLDHTLFFYGAGMSDSNIHYHYDLPSMVVAGAGTGIKGGRHLEHRGLPVANLQLSVLQALGIDAERFGDSTGSISL
jgi:hypothetical protein